MNIWRWVKVGPCHYIRVTPEREYRNGMYDHVVQHCRKNLSDWERWESIGRDESPMDYYPSLKAAKASFKNPN